MRRSNEGVISAPFAWKYSRYVLCTQTLWIPDKIDGVSVTHACREPSRKTIVKMV
ncbi:hypothetical protein [Edaphobacter sp.]|uniref:hypothetical protein n=1 Tax=Edaphobacter sp. TaxID=1934404 RepID=UPI002DB5F667|nr:hypothetical protein [Edaphobacter sp.]HEU5340455.1 hypothetical protein [Edaphobacter sp.]